MTDQANAILKSHLAFKTKDEVCEYVSRDFIECLECKKNFHVLPHHIQFIHNMATSFYRRKYNIPSDVPLTIRYYRNRSNEKTKFNPICVGVDCCICGHPIMDFGRRRSSKDHILPRERGGGIYRSDVKNIRFTCALCNTRLAQCNHCIGALICVMLVSLESEVSYGKVLKKWKMTTKR